MSAPPASTSPSRPSSTSSGCSATQASGGTISATAPATCNASTYARESRNASRSIPSSGPAPMRCRDRSGVVFRLPSTLNYPASQLDHTQRKILDERSNPAARSGRHDRPRPPAGDERRRRRARRPAARRAARGRHRRRGPRGRPHRQRPRVLLRCRSARGLRAHRLRAPQPPEGAQRALSPDHRHAARDAEAGHRGRQRRRGGHRLLVRAGLRPDRRGRESATSCSRS